MRAERKRPATNRKRTTARRLAMFAKALASDDPLGCIREMIAERTPEQKVVVWSYACILETNSARLPILLDRFNSPELVEIETALRAIGAERTLSDVHALHSAFDRVMREGVSVHDASDAVEASELGRTIGDRHEDHVQELEARLLDYCRQHLGDLAAG